MNDDLGEDQKLSLKFCTITLRVCQHDAMSLNSIDLHHRLIA
jgi:hypothetical protein